MHSPAASPTKSTRIQLRPITSELIPAVQRMNQVLFPVRYPDGFYQEIMGGELTRVAYCGDVLVGVVCARMEEEDVYIMTLGVLAPYREMGIGSKMVMHLVDYCTRMGTRRMYLHVHVSNEDGIRFYCQKHGFKNVGVVEGYYKRLQPKTAFILEKVL